MNITKFQFETTGVRVVQHEGSPWFVAADVCRVLDINNPRQALVGLDDDEIMTVSNNDGHSGKRGGAQSYNLVNESGLYALIMRSRKPQAKAFRKWVTSEVIPTIRKTGSYGTPKMPSPGDLARMVIEYERRMGLTTEVMDAVLPNVAYGSLTRSGIPRTGIRRATFVGARSRVKTAANVVSLLVQLDLPISALSE